MKRFKQTDAWISVFMIIGFPLMGIITRNEYYFTGYFFVGGWQLISMFVHFYSDWFMTKGGKESLSPGGACGSLHLGNLIRICPRPAAAALCHAHCRADHGDHLYFHLFY